MTDPRSLREAHIVALSGGKDSTAMALRLVETEPREYTFICTPTGAELPEMFAHWRRLREMLAPHPFEVLTAGVSLDGLIRKFNALPNWRMRWCTRLLKIEPFQQYVLTHRPAVVYVGLRADEEGREGSVYGNVEDVRQRFPLREWGWGLQAVISYLEQRGVTIPRRTDCGQCFFQTLWEWYVLWKEHPTEWAEAEEQEALTGHTFRSPQRDTQPAALAELRARFESGYVPREATHRKGMCRVCTI